MNKLAINNVISIFFLFLLVFDLRIISNVGSAIVTLGVSFFIFITNISKFIPKAEKVLFHFREFIFLFLIVVSYVFLRQLLAGAEDMSYLLTTLKTASIVMASLFYLIVFGNNIIHNIFYVFLINSIICLVIGTFPSFKFLIEYFQYPTAFGSKELIGLNEYRNSFLAGSGYFGVSSLYSLVFPIILQYVVSMKDFFYYLKFFIVMVGGVLAGRVALICYFISILYFSILKRNIKVIFFFTAMFFLGWFMLSSFAEFKSVYDWILELFIGDGGSESETLTQLKEMFYLPSDSTFLFGDGKYKSENGGYYGNSDVGYMRHLLFGGILFNFIIILTFLAIFNGLWRYPLVYIILFLSCFLHFKGVFIFNNPGFFPVVLSYSYYLYCQKKGVHI